MSGPLPCIIRGVPRPGPIPAGHGGPLCDLAGRLAAKMDWLAPPPRATAGQTIDIAVVLPASPLPVLRQCAALMMQMSAARPLWLWTLTDPTGQLAAELGAELGAWRGAFCRHEAGQPIADDALDAAARAATASPAAGPEPAQQEARLKLFDHHPPAGWMASGQRAAIGRSMVQVDGSGEALQVRGRIEVGNTSGEPLDGVAVQVTLRDESGAMLASLIAETDALPPGAVRLITLRSMEVLGTTMVASIDLRCEVLTIHRAALSATIEAG